MLGGQNDTGNKYFLFAIAGAIGAWLAGTSLVGMAEERHYTASGSVDMLDPHAIGSAMADPAFTASLTWGSFTLTGMYWALFLPLAMAAFTFVVVIVISRLRCDRVAP